MNLKYDYNNAPVCPYCDHEPKETYEMYENMRHDGDDSEIQCKECGKVFEYTIHFSRSYSSRPIEEVLSE
jgi:uncharacterized Zn finger protein